MNFNSSNIPADEPDFCGFIFSVGNVANELGAGGGVALGAEGAAAAGGGAFTGMGGNGGPGGGGGGSKGRDD